ncbi:MAG TPA: hypothetical protein VGQ43_09980 [Candidatus Udaeobacter sp.]|jgi:hypothetical protein|nr:hypothetical protein [Candidatus Udaeobacter sp.]
MKKTSFFSEIERASILAICCAALVFFASNYSALAQATTEEAVVITGEEVPSAYGAPPGFSRARFSNAVSAYVLPPWAFFFGELFEGQGFRHGPPDYLFTQEIEMGLPFRFNVAAEAQFERFNGGGGARSVSLEARWALAEWNKIPLNPTLFAEYKFGVGTIRHEEVQPPMGEGGEEEEEEEGGPPKVPDAYEFRLLLAQDFGEHVEWAMNWFFEKENTGDRGREWGFSQAAMTPILLPNERLKVGIEMQYKNTTVKGTRGDPLHSFTIGPTLAWKPTAQTRVDISPLFGCTAGAPVADVFVAFSWLFGGERGEAEAPVSSRFRYYTDAAYARSGKDSGKEMKQVAYVPPCPQWYGDHEWNLNLFGTYAFTNTEFAPNPSLVDIVQSTSEGGPVLGTYDRYIGGDHAWGGGGDIKYFFCRYAGVGVEGFVLDGSKPGFDIFEDQSVPVFVHRRINHNHTIGSVLGTFTLRYPIPCTRLAPYAWAGVGAIFGGGERDELHTQGPPDAFAVNAQTEHFGAETKLLGQFGAGLEFRFARNFGWTNDLSFGVIDGPRNNFGMFRSGVNFAF